VRGSKNMRCIMIYLKFQSKELYPHLLLREIAGAQGSASNERTQKESSLAEEVILCYRLQLQITEPIRLAMGTCASSKSECTKNVPSVQKKKGHLRAHAARKRPAVSRKRWTQKLCRNRREGGMRERAICAKNFEAKRPTAGGQSS